jgi:DnaK suppressor protein
MENAIMTNNNESLTWDAPSIRKRLEEELQNAEKQLAELERQLEDRPDFNLGEGSTGAQWWEMALARRGRVVAQIEEIKEAFTRLNEGTYGQCQRCGVQINPERLEILPTTAFCANCAREAKD